jgi:predicted nucleotidyltransferase
LRLIPLVKPDVQVSRIRLCCSCRAGPTNIRTWNGQSGSSGRTKKPRVPIVPNWRRCRRRSGWTARWHSRLTTARLSAMLEKDLLELLALFRSKGVEFLVVGGHAVAYHGYPRLTEDLDLFVRPDVANGARVVEALEEFGFGSLELQPSDFQAGDRVIQLGRRPNRVDLLTKLYGVPFVDAWSRRVAVSLDGAPVWMISREDLIQNKRATGRPQDAVDADALEGRA